MFEFIAKDPNTMEAVLKFWAGIFAIIAASISATSAFFSLKTVQISRHLKLQEIIPAIKKNLFWPNYALRCLTVG